MVEMVEMVGQAVGNGRHSRAPREEIEVVGLVGQASRYPRARRGEVKDDQLRMGYMLGVVVLNKAHKTDAPWPMYRICPPISARGSPSYKSSPSWK